jgi:hypothetical protein
MTTPGIWWMGLALLVLAVFPLLVYTFFSLVVLDRKSQGLIDDLKGAKAFEIPTLKDQLKDEATFKTRIETRYGYKRFLWPLVLVVFFNLGCFSVVWDIIYVRFFAGSAEACGVIYTAAFLAKAEFPMMAFLAVIVVNHMNMLRRLYVWDITTQVYWNALQRTWAAVIVVSVLAVSTGFFGPPSGTENSGVTAHILFFGAGLITNEVVRWIIDCTRKRLKIQRSAVEELPLSLIQGINYWHEIRLEEEGVENVQNLATCDLVELTIATRYNLRTLIDWVDQAILVHRMGQKARVLREEGFISGAIDMAWAAPENSAGDVRVAEQIAKTVKVEPVFVEALMNGLYQDAQIRMLWDMWQSKLDARISDKNDPGNRASRG